jgi:hypothetical protein
MNSSCLLNGTSKFLVQECLTPGYRLRENISAVLLSILHVNVGVVGYISMLV